MIQIKALLFASMAFLACNSINISSASAQNKVISLGLSDDLDVFRSEAKIIGTLLAKKFSPGVSPIIRSNSKSKAQLDIPDIGKLIVKAGEGLGPDDILIVYLTSHGTEEGGLVVESKSSKAILPPFILRSFLLTSGAKKKVLIVSACFSGAFTSLADDNTVVLTASDKNNPSFGCDEGERLTHFGKVLEIFLTGDEGENETLAKVLRGTKAGVRIFEQNLCKEDKRQCYNSKPQLVGTKQMLQILDQ